MNAKSLFYTTLLLSILVQIITGLIEVGALFIKVPTAMTLIRQLLIMEVIVQVVEGLFYIWLVTNITQISNITPKRYFDWMITTPTMLITLILYLVYLNKKTENNVKSLHLITLLKENANVIISVVVLNWFMLLFGFLGEMQIIPLMLGVFLGFIPFLTYYYLIYTNFVIESTTGSALFWYFFVFWSLYGLVAVLPYYIKNAFYNILDLFAKNFFGLFLSYLIFFEKYAL